MKIRRSVVTALLSGLAFTVALTAPSSGGGHPEARAQNGAGTSIFLQLPGVEGPSTAKGFEKQIELHSSSVGIARAPGTAGGMGAGKAVPSDFAVSKRVDTSSPALYVQAATGKHYATATVTVVSSAHVVVYKLTDVSISSYQTSASEGSEPQESLALSYTKFEVEVKAGSGAVKKVNTSRGGFDFTAYKAF